MKIILPKQNNTTWDLILKNNFIEMLDYGKNINHDIYQIPGLSIDGIVSLNTDKFIYIESIDGVAVCYKIPIEYWYNIPDTKQEYRLIESNEKNLVGYIVQIDPSTSEEQGVNYIEYNNNKYRTGDIGYIIKDTMRNKAYLYLWPSAIGGCYVPNMLYFKTDNKVAMQSKRVPTLLEAETEIKLQLAFIRLPTEQITQRYQIKTVISNNTTINFDQLTYNEYSLYFVKLLTYTNTNTETFHVGYTLTNNNGHLQITFNNTISAGTIVQVQQLTKVV